MKQLFVLAGMFLLGGCLGAPADQQAVSIDTLSVAAVDSVVVKEQTPGEPSSGASENLSDTMGGIVGSSINTGRTSPSELIDYAQTLMGTPYAWASTNPKVGFDCSGFITHVFNHFNITVPRSSIDFTNVGETVPIDEARKGDIILFTGTNPLETNVGHMGLIVSNNEEGLRFIHSTSGKAMGVTITPLNEQYRKRFVRVSRLFN